MITLTTTKMLSMLKREDLFHFLHFTATGLNAFIHAGLVSISGLH
jgi:hypothetical protein